MKNEPPVLIIMIPGFADGENDTTCLPAHQSLVLEINKKFPSNKIIILAFQYPFLKNEFEWHQNKLIAFGGRNRGGLSRLLLWRRIRKKFKQLGKEQRIVGILSFWFGETALLANRIAREHKLPHYCWIMGQDAKKNNHYVQRVKPAPGQLIAISDFIRDEFARNHLVLPQHVIPLGVGVIQENDFSSKRDIDIIGVGSLIPLKQFDLFIHIVRGAKKLFPDLRVLICGKGPEEDRLRSLIEKNGLSKNVRLTGELPHDEVLYLMRGSRILLHPSSYEGFSGVCVEALQCGVHVLSFCKPMKHDIPNWHVVDTTEMMKEKIYVLLGSELIHNSVNAYPVELAAMDVMKLFGG